MSIITRGRAREKDTKGAKNGKGVRKRRPDELMRSVIHETTVPSSIELLRANTLFALPSGTTWVILGLYADEIGGLNKRQSRDEAKGQVVELIGADHIHTVVTGDMLDDELLGIIPDETTLGRMNEFALLTGATYRWVVVWAEDGDLRIRVGNEDEMATFEQAQAVARGETDLGTAIGADLWGRYSGAPARRAADPGTGDQDEPEATGVTELVHETSGPDTLDDLSGLDDLDGLGELGPDVPDTGLPFDDEDDTADLVAIDENEAAPTGAVPAEDTMEAVDDPEPFDQATARAVIVRRFLAEDLDLPIRLDEFDATFAIGAPSVAIEVGDNTSEWLGDQVAQLTRTANADLAQRHRAHEDELRTLYVNLMSEHAEAVEREVSMDREDSRYRRLRDAAQAEHDQRIAVRDEQIRRVKAEVAADWDAQARRTAEQAAASAETQFRERNRTRMERAQADAATEITTALEDEHSRNQQEILRLRKRDAQLLMQKGQTSAFQVLAEKQQGHLDDEASALADWKQRIEAVIDAHRKDDIARVETLATQQRTIDEVTELRAQHERAIEAMRIEHEDRQRRMEAELARQQEDFMRQLQARDIEHEHAVSVEQERTRAQSDRVSDLLAQLGTIEQSVAARYEQRMTDLQSSRDAAAEDRARIKEVLADANDIQHRSNKLMIVLIIALSIIMLGSGFIFGVSLG